MLHRFCWALLACLAACDSAKTPPLAIPTEVEVADEFVLELIEEHAWAARADLGDAGLRGTLGLIYEANDLWAWAAQAFANAAELDADDPRWSYHEALANFKTGNSERGDQLVASVAERFPSFVPGRFRYGVSLMDQGQVEAALVQFRTCTEMSPEYAEGWASMAEALVLLDRFAEAKTHMDTVLVSVPGFTRANYVRGLALQGLGDTEAAELDLTLGTGSKRGLIPDNLAKRRVEYAMGTHSMLSRSMALINSGQFRPALTLAEKALAREPDHIRLLNAQAIAYRRLKQPKRSIEILSRAQALEPQDLGTLTVLSGSYFDVRDYGQSLEAAEAAAQVAPETGVVHYLRGRALLALARMPEASQVLRLSIQLDPSRSMAYLYLAESLGAQGRYDEAEPIWKEALAREPRNLPALFNLGMTQIALLKVEDAALTLETIRSFDMTEPRNKDVEQRLSTALSKLTGL